MCLIRNARNVPLESSRLLINGLKTELLHAPRGERVRDTLSGMPRLIITACLWAQGKRGRARRTSMCQGQAALSN